MTAHFKFTSYAHGRPIQTKENATRLTNVMAYDEDNHLYLNDDMTIGFAFSAMPLVNHSQDQITVLNAMLASSLTPGSLLQLLLYKSPFDAFSFQTKLYVSYKFLLADTKPTEEEIQHAVHIQSTIKTSLESIGFELDRIDPLSLINIIHSFYHGSDKQFLNWDSEKPIHDQIFGEDLNLELNQNGHLTIGKKSVKCLTSKYNSDEIKYGDAIHYTGDLLTGSHTIDSTHAIVVNLFKPKPDIEKGEEPLPDDELNLSFHLILFSDSHDHSTALAQKARVYFRRIQFEIMDDTFIQLPIFSNSIPLSADINTLVDISRYKTINISKAIPLLPFFSEHPGGRSGISLVTRALQYYELPVDEHHEIVVFDSISNVMLRRLSEPKIRQKVKHPLTSTQPSDIIETISDQTLILIAASQSDNQYIQLLPLTHYQKYLLRSMQITEDFEDYAIRAKDHFLIVRVKRD